MIRPTVEVPSEGFLLAEVGLRPVDEMPGEVLDRGREVLIDFIGSALAGSIAPSSQSIYRFLESMAVGGRSSIIGLTGTTAPVWAALANGTSAHTTEMDDVEVTSSLHPGVTVIPAALVIAEELATSGRDVLAAIVSGYETTIRVGRALDPAGTYARGFHPRRCRWRGRGVDGRGPLWVLPSISK